MENIVDEPGGKLRMRILRFAVILIGKDGLNPKPERIVIEGERPNFLIKHEDEHGQRGFGIQAVTFGNKGQARDYMERVHPEIDRSTETHFAPVMVEVRQISDKEYKAFQFRSDALCLDSQENLTPEQRDRIWKSEEEAQKKLEATDSLPEEERWKAIHRLQLWDGLPE